MKITLKQLQVFLAVAKHENLIQASEELYLSKGAVSQALQELEKQLDIQLFDRVHPHLHLNSAGKQLRPLADKIIRNCTEAENLFKNEKEYLLNIGVSKTIGTHILPKVFEEFEHYFNWLPQAHIANTNNLVEQLTNFSLDAVLLEGEIQHQEIITEKWIQDEMVVLAHQNHPLADGFTHHIEELKNSRWILREPNSGTREFFEHHLGVLLNPYTVAQSLTSPEAVLAMVEQGLGLTFTSKLIAQLPDFNNRFGIIHLPQKFSRTFSICYHKKKNITQKVWTNF